MRRWIFLWCGLLLCHSCGNSTAFSRADTAPGITVKTGIEVLKASGFAQLKGKRVGLVTNPTGVDNNLTSTVDILYRAPEVNLVALFGPEHGVRGNAHAGDHVGSDVDALTGLPLISLYGASLKPTAEMLDNIDVLVYDIQDIVSRSFTYISTMGVCMEACAENGKEFMVLDRPNPVGGLRVEGSFVEDSCFSFVSRYRIPYVYGLTCGELALLLNGEKMLGPGGTPNGEGLQCQLTVIPMEGWTRDMPFEKTGLQWIPSSPHIPQSIHAYYYPLSGIVGDLGLMSIGVGYTLPFQCFATDSIPAEDLAARLNGYRLPGLHFRPIYYKPYYNYGVGRQLQGVQVHITNPAIAPLTPVNFYVMQAMHELKPDWDLFSDVAPSRMNMLRKVTGSRQIVELFRKRYQYADIEAYWTKDVSAFKALSQQYYLYPCKTKRPCL